MAYCKRDKGLLKVNGWLLELVQPVALQFKLQEPIPAPLPGTGLKIFCCEAYTVGADVLGQVRRHRHKDLREGRRPHQPDLGPQAGALQVAGGLLPDVLGRAVQAGYQGHPRPVRPLLLVTDPRRNEPKKPRSLSDQILKVLLIALALLRIAVV